MPQISKETAIHIAVENVKRQKGTENVDVSEVEGNGEIWTVRGTCPIDLDGHKWIEKFAVALDFKGNVRSVHYALI